MTEFHVWNLLNYMHNGYMSQMSCVVYAVEIPLCVICEFHCVLCIAYE
jgi:hypothetical protein